MALFTLLLMLLCLYAALLPVTIQMDVHHFDTTRLQIQLRMAGLHKTWRLMLLRTGQGRRIVLESEQGIQPLDAGQIRQSRGSVLLDALLRADQARLFLLRHTRLEQMQGLILLCTSDAARSALVTGALRGVLACIPAMQRKNVQLRVLPEFFRPHSTVDARCIIRLRVGTLVLTAVLLLLA